MSCETTGIPMLTTMVSGYYDASGSDVYPPCTETYGEYCYGVQDICSQMACGYHGPPGGVRMVNGNSGPMTVPMQVPTGHLVHHFYDENGTVRFLFSHPVPVHVGAHYSPSHAATPSAYYAYPQPSYAAPPQFHPQPPGPMQTAMNPQGIHGMMQPPSPQCNAHSPTQTGTSPPPTPSQVAPSQKENRYPSQMYKYRRKIPESRAKDSAKLVLLPSQSSLKKERRKSKLKLEDGIGLNGSCGSNASEDDDMSWMQLSEYLSNLRPPSISDVTSRSAVISWKPPELPSSDTERTDQNEVTYEVMMCEKLKEGHLRSVYNGNDCSCAVTSLKPSTEYYVCLQASLDDIRGSTVKGPVFKTFGGLDIEAPQPPRLFSRARNSLILKWTNPSDACTKVKSFVLDCDEGSGGQSFVTIYSGLMKQFKVNKLFPATWYKFRLAIVTDKGKSSYSSIVSFSTSGNCPSQPLPPTLKQAFLNRLHLEWDKRSSDSDFFLQIEDEHMRHGFLTAYSGRDTSFVCCGLRGNTEYKFRLCANNEEGSSLWSRVVTYCTLPDKLSCPGKPLPKGRIHASCFRLMWEPPKENKQPSITKYILEVDRGFGYEAVYTGPDTEFFLENLLPGTTYKLRVACISSTGHSPYSDVNSITTAAVCPGKCSAPRLQSKPESSFLCLEWAHPEYDGGSSVTEYEVDMTSPDNITLQAYRGSEMSCVISDLSPGRPYLFQVRAYNRVGAGPWSEPLEVVSGAGPPDPPRNFSVQCSSVHSCTLCWNEPVNNGAAITSYQLMMNVDESSDDEENYKEVYEGLSLKHEVSGLVPSTQYSFKIRAVNDAGPGVHTDAVTCKTHSSVPGPVPAIKVCPTSTSLYLSWTQPSSNGSAIKSYNVELDDYLYSTESDIPELCIEDLAPESLYRIRVQAVNGIGEGHFSDMMSVSTLKSPPDAPDLDCISITHNSLKLKWGDGRNHDAFAFTLEMSNSRTKSFVPIYHGTGMCHKVNRLQENSVYTFRICASSLSGQGPYSKSFSFTTAKAPPPLLRAPKVSGISESGCLVEWAGAKHFAGHSYSYQLQLLVDGNNSGTIVYQGADTKCNLTELEPQTPYAVRVASIRHYQDDEDLVGVASPSSNFTTLPLAELTSPAASVEHPSHAVTITFSERRTLRDRQWAAILDAVFVLIGFLVAILLEYVFDMSQGS